MSGRLSLTLMSSGCLLCKTPFESAPFCKHCGAPSEGRKVVYRKTKAKKQKLPFKDNGFFTLSFLSGLVLLSSTVFLDRSSMTLGLGVFLLVQAGFVRRYGRSKGISATVLPFQ